MRQIALDTETTGLMHTHHRIIEIGAIELIDRQLTGNIFHCYFNPERDIDIEAEKIHGLSRKFLSNHPKFSEKIDEFLAFIEHAELIIHNAPFDLGFLNSEFTRVNKTHNKNIKFKYSLEKNLVIDTLVLARQLLPGQHHNLDALCQLYHINNSNRILHGAAVDAELLARVYLAMTQEQSNFLSNLTPHAELLTNFLNVLTREKLPLSKAVIYQADHSEITTHQRYITDCLEL